MHKEQLRIKMVLFDADGTLWNFTTEKRDEKRRTRREAKLDPDTLPLLKKLKKQNIRCIIISFQSHKNKQQSKAIVKSWLKSFMIDRYFEEIVIVSAQETYKDFSILNILSSKGLKKKEVILVGDRYRWDILPARRVGIRSYLLLKPENKEFRMKKIRLGDLIQILHLD